MREEQMRYTFAIAVILMLVGCATTEGYRQHMEQYVGRTSDELLLEFGAPDRVDPLNNGDALWSYDREEQRVIPGGYRTLPQERLVTYTDAYGERVTRKERYDTTVYEPGQSWWAACDTRFVIGQDGMVRDFRFEGEACVATELY